jgi:FkbM family methyltransferase
MNSSIKKLKGVLKGKLALSVALRPFDISVKLREPDPYSKLNSQLVHYNVTKILDVGANRGQFALAMRKGGYRNRMVSFEPLPEAHSLLTEAARTDRDWLIAPRAAVGAALGTANINVSKNSHSSSLLKVTKTSTDAAPKSAFVGTVETPVITLDGCDLVKRDANVFIKIDTQGFEMEVLKGATELLKTVKGVQLEMSFTPMYEGAPDFETLYKFMIERGFELWGMDTAFRDPKTRRLYQVDATFFRKA